VERLRRKHTNDAAIEPFKMLHYTTEHQRFGYEQEAGMELTELFVNIIDFVFRSVVLLSGHK